MSKRAYLGEFEQMVLLAILRLRDEAFGPGVAQELEHKAGRQVSRGALYATLERLERKGLLEWEIEAATSATKGNRRRRFTVTAAGIEQLAAARETLVGMWEGIEDVLRRRAT